MPRRESAPTGAPIWVDLFTSDPDRSRAFYGEIFGWSCESAAEFGGYLNFAKDDVAVAGGMRNDGESGSPDGWSVYLASNDAAATVAAAAAHGGGIELAPMPVGDLGTMAFVTDPGGGRIGVWQPGSHTGFGVLGDPGSPGWFELFTPAYDATVAFYRDVFSWDAHTMSDTPEFRYTTLGEGDGAMAGIMDASGFQPTPPAQWSIYFAVADTDATLAQIVDLGGSVRQPAEDTPHGRVAEAADPTGATFKVVEGV